MSSIDERIVQMQFENSQFEKGVKESLKSLEELKEGLQLEKAAEGLKRLQEAGDSFSLAKIGDGIDNLGDRFSAFGTFAGRIIENLADTVYHKLGGAIESVTVGQISAGWDKYAEDTKAVQTIMFATGKSIEEVETELQKLTWFTDETSYSYSDMVSNIGKFTSNNIDLTEARVSMQGIATWAASAGQDAQTASRAMYNISQAMGVGAMKVMDWKSIELANMATTDFKKNAIETAIALGKLDANGVFTETLASGKLKQTQVTIENFRDTLQTGWFDKDVMLQVFSDYGEFAEKVQALVEETGMSTSEAIKELSGTTNLFSENAFKAAQEAKTFGEAIEALRDATSTKWLNIFKLIFGNYEQAKELWTKLANDLYDVFVDPLDSLVEVFRAWHEESYEYSDDEMGHRLANWKDFMQGVYDIMDGLKGILITVRDSFENLFPGITLEKLSAFSQGVKDFGASFKSAFGLPEDVEETIDTVEEFADSVTQATKAIDNEVKQTTEDVEKLDEALKRGSRGDDVKAMQEMLIALGYDLGSTAADGIFVPKTQKALKDYELAAGLVIDGVYDEATQKSLAKSFDLGEVQKGFEEFDKELKKGDRNDEVRRMQQHLIDLGFALDKYGADGIWGPETQAAYEKFCEAYELDPTEGYNAKAHATMKRALGYEDAVEATEQLIKNTQDAQDATERYSTHLDRIRAIAGGIFAAGGIILKIVGAIGKGIAYVWSLTKPLQEAFLIAAAAIGEALINFNNWLGTDGAISGWFSSVQKWLEPFGGWMERASKSFLLFFGLKKPAEESEKKVITLSQVWKTFTDNIKKTAIFKNISNAIKTLKGAIDKITPTVKNAWKTFKSNIGKGLLTVLKGLGFALMVVAAPIGIVINLLAKLIGFVVSQIPKGIQLLKDLWGALTFEGDASLGKAPGILAKAKNFASDIFGFLFGKTEEGGNGEKIRKDGIFTRIGALLAGDIAGFTKGMSEENAAKAVKFAEDIRGIYEIIRDNLLIAYSSVAYLLTGNLGYSNGLSFETIGTLDTIRHFFDIVGEAINQLFTGEESDNSLLSEKTRQNINDFRTNILGTINNIKTVFKQIGEGIVYLFTGKASEETSLSEDQIEKIKNFRAGANRIFDLIYLLFTGNKRDGGLLFDSQELAVSEFRKTVLGYFDTIKNAFKTVGSAIKFLFTGQGGELLSDDWKGRIEWFRNKCIDIFGSIQSNLSTLWPKIKVLFTGDATNSGLSEEDAKNVLDFRNRIVGFFGNVGKTFKKIFAAAQYLFTGEGPEDILSRSTIEKILQFRKNVSDVFKSIGGFLSGLWGDLKDVFKNGINFESIKKALGVIWGYIGGFFSQIWKTGKTILKWGIVGFLLYKVGMLIGNISGAFSYLQDVIGGYKKNTQTLSKSVLEFGAAIALIVASVWVLGQMDEKQFKRGAIAVSIIAGAIVLILAASAIFLKKDTGKKISQVGKSIWDFAKAVGIIAATVAILSFMPWKTFLNGFLKVVILCGLMTHVIKKINGIGATSIKMQGLFGMAAAIGILALTVGLLAHYKWKTLGKGLIALYGIVFILRGLMKTMGKFGSRNVKLKGFIGLSLAIGVLAIIVRQLAKMKTKSLIKGILALYAICFTIGRTIKAIGSVVSPNIGGLVATVLTIGLVMAGLVVALRYVKDIDPKVIAAFSVGFAAIVSATALLAKWSSGATFTGVTAAALGLLEIIAAIAIVCAAFGGLRKIPGFQEFMESGAESIGRILGTLAGSIAQTVVDQFGAGMSSISSLPEADPDGVENAIQCASLLQKFAEGLPSKDIPNKILDFFGMSEFSEFSKDIGNFGEGFNTFATQINSIESFDGLEEKTNTAISISNSINNFSKQLPEKENASKFVEFVTGSEISQFARDMANFSIGFNKYATQLNAIETTEGLQAKTNLAMIIARSINNFSKQLPEKGNFTKIVETFTGSEFEKFSNDLAGFGSAINDYATEMSTINYSVSLEDKTRRAVEIAGIVADFLEELNKLNIENDKGAIEKWFTGDTKSDTVFNSIGKLASSIKDSSSDFSGLGSGTLIDDIKSATIAARLVASLINYLSSKEFNLDMTIINDYGGSQSVFDVLMERIVSMGTSVASFAQSVEGIDLTSIAYVIESITGFLELLSSDTQITSSDILSGLDSESISSRFAEIITGIRSAVTTSGESLQGIGTDMTDSILSGLTSADISKASELATKMVDKLSEYNKSFQIAGENFVYGLSSGVYLKARFAIESAAYVARSMVATIKKIFQTASPSKVTTQIGEYFSQGLSRGVDGQAASAIDSASDVASNMLSAARGTLTTLSDLLSQDIDADPVITPVVDLTNAQNAAGSISSLFGQQSAGLTMTRTLVDKADVDRNGLPIKQNAVLSAENMNLLRQDIDAIGKGIDGMGNESVVSEIQSLSDKFADLAEAVTNMKLVLDTGALVGGTSSAYDRQFGITSVRRDRGN